MATNWLEYWYEDLHYASPPRTSPVQDCEIHALQFLSVEVSALSRVSINEQVRKQPRFELTSKPEIFLTSRKHPNTQLWMEEKPATWVEFEA